MDFEFEWDDRKNRKNKKKHGISFEHAMLVFKDEDRIEEYDADHSYDEDRFDVIGMVDQILFVVCVYKGDNVIRLISARKADKEERSRYYGDY